tara:strand:+ start:313 stop:603 length:291 start_codon:yes stop_codon:yes gene_type:complete
MAAYIIAFAAVKDRNKLADYSASAGPTIGPAGGALVARTKVIDTIAGDFSADAALILKFDTADAARAWYDSPEYQKLIPLRDEGMVANFVLVEDVS